MGEFRRLAAPDQQSLAEFFATSPERMLLARARAAQPADLWGWRNDQLQAIALLGANTLLHGSPDAAADIAELLQRRRGAFRTLVGDAPLVLAVLGELAATRAGEPWLLRASQPFLLLAAPPIGRPAGVVRPAELTDLPAYTRAGVEMYRGELESEPDVSGLRKRFAAGIRQGRCFAWVERGEVRFKCDVSVVVDDVCHIQGVWLDPRLRGRQLSAGLLTDVLQQVQADIAPKVTLYVNDFNAAALRLYEQVGFKQIGSFASAFY